MSVHLVNFKDIQLHCDGCNALIAEDEINKFLKFKEENKILDSYFDRLKAEQQSMINGENND